MNDIENIKIKISELNLKSNDAFQESKQNELINEKQKSLKVALEKAEESYKQ
jgi:hypothetical protein